jgi:hypothetical protein
MTDMSEKGDDAPFDKRVRRRWNIGNGRSLVCAVMALSVAACGTTQRAAREFDVIGADRSGWREACRGPEATRFESTDGLAMVFVGIHPKVSAPTTDGDASMAMARFITNTSRGKWDCSPVDTRPMGWLGRESTLASFSCLVPRELTVPDHLEFRIVGVRSQHGRVLSVIYMGPDNDWYLHQFCDMTARVMLFSLPGPEAEELLAAGVPECAGLIAERRPDEGRLVPPDHRVHNGISSASGANVSHAGGWTAPNTRGGPLPQCNFPE